MNWSALSEERTLQLAFCVNQRGAGHSMQKYAYSICYLVAPACLVFEQYCYFDGFWLRMLSVQFTACTDGSKRCYCKNIHSNTFSRPFRYLHSLDYPLTFYLVISNKKMHPIPCY